MPDNLTIEFKKVLERQGIVATDSQIESFLKTQNQAKPSPPVNLGGSLYENAANPAPVNDIAALYNNNVGNIGDAGSSMSKEDAARNVYEGLGIGLWEYFDTALLGLPGIGLQSAGIDPIEKYKELAGVEELTPAGKIGEVVGVAAGFLKPMKWVSKGVGAITSRVVAGGGKKVVSSVIGDATKVAAETPGFTANVFKKSLEVEFKTDATSKLLSNYSLSPAAIKAVQGQLKNNVGKAIQTSFPKAEAALVDEMAEAITLNLGKNGKHINSVGQWIQKALGKTLNLESSSKISKYVAHAGEMTVSFGMYNTMANGIQAMAGNEEFDLKGNFYHALTFSAFLPFVEMLPGGGRIPIVKTTKDIKRILKTYKNSNYNDMSRESLNGILKIITNNNHLKEKSYGVIASNNAWRDLSKKEAIKVLEEIKTTGGIDKVWSEFAVEAGKDLGRSVGRMAAGAFYFNAQTLMDEQQIKNIDPEVLGAHMLVGAFFTRMRKPIFQNEMPTLTDFQSKLGKRD